MAGNNSTEHIYDVMNNNVAQQKNVADQEEAIIKLNFLNRENRTPMV